MVSNRPICLRCFRYDHHRSECSNDPIITCSTCFALNYLTRDCCKLPRRPNDEYFQSFRLVGNEKTRFFTDIQVGNKMVAALIDTNRTQTVIDWVVADVFRQQTSRFRFIPAMFCEVELPRPNPATLKCKITTLPGDLRIILGMDYLAQRHVQLTLSDVKLLPREGKTVARSPAARFKIDAVLGSKSYTSVIDTTYTRSQIEINLLNYLEKQPQCYYNYKTRLCNVAVTWRGKTAIIAFTVKRCYEHEVILGTDFLKEFGFTFALDGVSLDINNPWKTSHQDAIQFAYNHEQGKELARIIETEKLERLQDTVRPMLQYPTED